MSGSPNPSVSVIVPVYNGEKTILSCLNSIIRQDYASFEIIVVDNNSTDSTVEIVNSFNYAKLLFMKDIQSSYASRNLGIANSNGEIVAFTDADCIAAPNWLSKLAAAFQDEAVMIATGRVLDGEVTNIVERFLKDIRLFSRHNETNSHFLRSILIGCTAYRRLALEEVGCFNANLYTGGDIDLGWRTQIKYGDCVRYVPEAIVYHQHRSTVRGMFRQYRRHGFGEVFLDAMYRDYPGYPRNLRYQIGRILQQLLALFTYTRSFIFRAITYPIHRDKYNIAQPFLWFIAESGNLFGKIQALCATRGLRLNPASRQWQDPGG